MSGHFDLPSGLEPIREWGGDLWLAALSHHGTPIKYNDINEDKYKSAPRIWEPLAGADPVAALKEFGAAARPWFPKAFAKTVEPVPATAHFIHAFAGLVSVADWIASNPAPGFFTS